MRGNKDRREERREKTISQHTDDIDSLSLSVSLTHTQTHNYWSAFSHTHTYTHLITHACKLTCSSMQEHSGLIRINVTMLYSRTQKTLHTRILGSTQMEGKHKKYLHNSLYAQCDDTECSGFVYLWVVTFYPWLSLEVVFCFYQLIEGMYDSQNLINKFSVGRCSTGDHLKYTVV